ncbi:MAG: DNA polymerase III subunit delta, partial [Clostridia bacterium]|nr:DNA polymerase III subunit delta [Clostridia bacterium]
MAAKKDKCDVDTLAILKQDLAGNNPARLYLFYGEESYLKSHYLGMLEKQCAGVFPDFDLVRLDGDTVTVDDLRDAIESLPMGGERKLVEVLDYNIFGSGPLKEALPEILAQLPDYVCLVFV